MNYKKNKKNVKMPALNAAPGVLEVREKAHIPAALKQYVVEEIIITIIVKTFRRMT